MNKLVFLIGLLLVGCGGGSGSPVALINDLADTPVEEPVVVEEPVPTEEPVLISHTTWGGNAVRALPTSVNLASIERGTRFQFITHSIRMSRADRVRYIKPNNTYDVSFWGSFRIIGSDGIEYSPIPENSNSADEKHIKYAHFGDVGSCVDGFNGFIDCQFLYEVPQDFVAKKATFMDDIWFVEAIIDEPLV